MRTVEPGWWAVWSPFLAGSCNNDDDAGLCAFDELPSGEMCMVEPARIGLDGAIYGIPLEGAYKLQSPS